MVCPSQTLDDLLADPLVQALMRADRVETPDLRRMMRDVAEKRREAGLDFSRARLRFCGQTRASADAPVRC